MRPEDIPEDVWEKVGQIFWTTADSHHAWGALEQLPAEWADDVQERLSRAIMAAKAEQREHDAKLVENFSPIQPAFETEDDGGQKWPHPAEQLPIYNPAKLAAAIRGRHAPE